MTNEERYAEKIGKLLRKAESTSSQHEAEALIEKAQSLMTTYAIDEAMLARARGDSEKEREEIVEKDWDYTGMFNDLARPRIATTVATRNGCRVLHSDMRRYTKPGIYRLHVIGFESDVERARMLETSIQLQAMAALTSWWGERRNDEDMQWRTGHQKVRVRCDFLLGFEDGLREVLDRGNAEGQRESAKHEAEQQNVSVEEASESVALVVRDRKDAVNDWIDEKYGKLRKKSSRRYGSGTDARGAGAEAGRRADVGQTSVGGAAAGVLNR